MSGTVEFKYWIYFYPLEVVRIWIKKLKAVSFSISSMLWRSWSSLALQVPHVLPTSGLAVPLSLLMLSLF